jgi:hypothetical protein
MTDFKRLTEKEFFAQIGEDCTAWPLLEAAYTYIDHLHTQRSVQLCLKLECEKDALLARVQELERKLNPCKCLVCNNANATGNGLCDFCSKEPKCYKGGSP